MANRRAQTRWALFWCQSLRRGANVMACIAGHTPLRLQTALAYPGTTQVVLPHIRETGNPENAN